MNQIYQVPPEYLFTSCAALVAEELRVMDFMTPYLWNCQIHYSDKTSQSQLITNDRLLYTSSDVERMTNFLHSVPSALNQNQFSNFNHTFLNQCPQSQKGLIQKIDSNSAGNQSNHAQKRSTNDLSGQSNESLPRFQQIQELKVTDSNNGEQITQSHHQVGIFNDQAPLSKILLDTTFRNEMIERLFNAHFKQFYRQDEIYKKIIRRLVRAQRIKFKQYVMDFEGRQVYDSLRAEHYLNRFIHEKYQIQLPLSRDEQEFAKSTVYTFGAKTREANTFQEQKYRVRQLRNQFLEKGTQREAEKFFRSEIGFKLFFHDFAALLIFGNQRCNQNNNWKVLYGFKKLLKRLLGHQHFKTMLQSTVGDIFIYQDTFPKAYASSF